MVPAAPCVGEIHPAVLGQLADTATPQVALASLSGVSLWGVMSVIVSQRVDDSGRSRLLTVATMVTLVRGGAGASLLGVLAVDSLSGGVAWLPGVLFAVAGLLDGLDGWIARTTDTVSAFGGRLDTEADGLLVLVGSILVVADGYAPVWFLAVGAARYLFVAGCWLRSYRGLVVGEDDARALRVTTYVTAMVGLWAALLPVTGPRQLFSVLSVVGAAMLLSFCRSWLVVSGRL